MNTWRFCFHFRKLSFFENALILPKRTEWWLSTQFDSELTIWVSWVSYICRKIQPKAFVKIGDFVFILENYHFLKIRLIIWVRWVSQIHRKIQPKEALPTRKEDNHDSLWMVGKQGQLPLSLSKALALGLYDH